MAKIVGVTSGLIVTESTTVVAERKASKTPKLRKGPTEYECTACGSRWVQKGKGYFGDPDEPAQCTHCSLFFGIDYRPGCTNVSADDAKQKITAAVEQKFVMCLRELTLAAFDGNSIEVGAGDIFAWQGTGYMAENLMPSKEKTWGMFTIKVQVGPYTITLFPHEFSAISFKTIMELRTAGEIVDCFIATNDQNGHFTPNPKLKKKIDAIFGHLTGKRPYLYAPTRKKS